MAEHAEDWTPARAAEDAALFLAGWAPPAGAHATGDVPPARVRHFWEASSLVNAVSASLRSPL